MGAEFKGKGGQLLSSSLPSLLSFLYSVVHVALGPMMNLMRAPAAGRNWEGYGQSAFLLPLFHIPSLVSVEEAILIFPVKSHSKL